MTTFWIVFTVILTIIVLFVLLLIACCLVVAGRADAYLDRDRGERVKRDRGPL